MSEKLYMGMELGSTRIKSVLINESGVVVASGSHTWENHLEGEIWSYYEHEIWQGVKASFAELSANAGDKMQNIDAMGFSAMMHGYIALDKDGNLLAPFRTWRNTNTPAAADALTELFGVNIPLRWSIAQLYQSILDDEAHVRDICYLTTLSGYVHYKLTGERALGVGDASGMFPIDVDTCDYDQKLIDKFDALVAHKGYPWKIRDILPSVLPAGKVAGYLTCHGAKLLGFDLEDGKKIPLCPPEGDGDTGMVATNSVRQRTGNVSAGTSVFAMVVMQRALSGLYRDIDTVTTPDGYPVAMVQCNNCTSDLDAWARMFGEFAGLLGKELSTGELMSLLFRQSVGADSEGLINYNYLAGDRKVGLTRGRPLFVRQPDAKLTLGGFMRAQIYSCLASLAIGMDTLKKENVEIDAMCGHGGFFKTDDIGQRAMSAAIGAPVTVFENAGEGGAWGVALLAGYIGREQSLADYLDSVFANSKQSTVSADEDDVKAFNAFLDDYKKAFEVEKLATEIF